MKSIETSGKTVEDAVKTGLQELRCDSSDVIIDVLDVGSPGLFGMFGRLAKVRLTMKEKLDLLDYDFPVMSLDLAEPKSKKEKKREDEPRPSKRPAPQPQPQQLKQEPKAEQPKPMEKKPPEAKKPEPKKPEAKAEPASATAQPARRTEDKPQPQNRPTKQRPQREPRPVSAPREAIVPTPAEDLPPLDEGALSEKGRIALAFLRDLTAKMGVQVEIRIAESEEHMMVQMIGDTLGILIGRRGDTLDALQYLTSLKVNKDRDDYTRVTLDTEHYRHKREEALNKLAMRMASRAHKTGHRVALEPMNPYERRILHSALQNHPYVSTHSEGDEPYRRVIITVK